CGPEVPFDILQCTTSGGNALRQSRLITARPHGHLLECLRQRLQVQASKGSQHRFRHGIVSHPPRSVRRRCVVRVLPELWICLQKSAPQLFIEICSPLMSERLEQLAEKTVDLFLDLYESRRP